MITAPGLVFNIVWFRTSGRNSGGGSGSRRGGGRMERGEFTGESGDGLLRKGAEGGEAAADDAGGDFGGTVGEV